MHLYYDLKQFLISLTTTLASFIDKQHDPKFIDGITFVDEDGDRCGMAFKIPKSKEDIKDSQFFFTNFLIPFPSLPSTKAILLSKNLFFLVIL